MASEGQLWSSRHLRQVHQLSDKARRVQRVFDAIAGRYDLFNTVASFGLDHAWRRRLVRQAAVLGGKCVLDLCCGPGTLTVRLAATAHRPRCLVGLDFSLPMLALANRRSRILPGVAYCCGDALHLPFADETFDLVTCAFGIRNFQNLPTGLRELHRVLKFGGVALILEFALPASRTFRAVYRLYLQRMLPLIGRIVAGDKVRAYEYLPCSVKTFYAPQQLSEMFRTAGFEVTDAVSLTGGAVWLYQLRKPEAE